MQPFLICSSVIVLRKKYPNMARPYKVWLYPVSVWLIILIMVGLCLNTLIEDPRTSLIGLIVPLAGPWHLPDPAPPPGSLTRQRAQFS